MPDTVLGYSLERMRIALNGKLAGRSMRPLDNADREFTNKIESKYESLCDELVYVVTRRPDIDIINEFAAYEP